MILVKTSLVMRSYSWSRAWLLVLSTVSRLNISVKIQTHQYHDSAWPRGRADWKLSAEYQGQWWVLYAVESWPCPDRVVELDHTMWSRPIGSTCSTSYWWTYISYSPASPTMETEQKKQKNKTKKTELFWKNFCIKNLAKPEFSTKNAGLNGIFYMQCIKWVWLKCVQQT